jgi:dTMP kinase
MHKGLFLVLEGGEGAGKSTQIALLKERLPVLFPEKTFVFTREPGGSPFATEIRNLILSDSAKEASGHTMLGLFMAARADHVEKVIVPAIRAGKVVVCDRYLGATYAYQIVGQQHPELKELYRAHVACVPQPDLTLFLDVDPALAHKRIALRTGEQTHFDMRETAFHERIRHGFKEYFATLPKDRVVVVDASASVEEMGVAIETLVSKRIRTLE